MDEIRHIAIEDLHEPFVLMRPVLKGSIEYLERVDSISRDGFLNSILVRPSPRKPGKFEVVDGNWRYTVALELRLLTIPCIIKTGLTDNDVIAYQIKANEVRKASTPIEIAKHLKRIFQSQPSLTIIDLAKLTGKSVAWIKDNLDLLDLSEPLQAAVDRGEICVSSAYRLAKIPRAVRATYVDSAKVMPPAAFKRLASQVAKHCRDSMQKGRLESNFFLSEFKPKAHLRTLMMLKKELENPVAARRVLAEDSASTARDGWEACLRWVLHLDKASVEEQKQMFVKHSKKQTITDTRTFE